MREDFDIREQQFNKRERDFENALRPLNFSDFNGQDKVVDNLRIFVKAARLRGEALDHVLLHGPPGLGKTTLSNIIANELGVGFKVTSGPVLDKPGDLAGVLTSLEPNDVLFIDEIHRLSPVVEEYLYSAMEDYRIDIMIDKGPVCLQLRFVPVSASTCTWSIMMIVSCDESSNVRPVSSMCLAMQKLPARLLREAEVLRVLPMPCFVVSATSLK